MNIDFLIVAIFLMATLVIGFHYTLKETTFQEYAVGDKKIGTWVLAASLLATYTNGITIEGMTWMYSLGLLSLINRFSMTIGFLFIARFVLIKSKDMITNHYSMSDFLGKLYGFWCRQLSAWIVVAGAILIMAGLIFSMQEVAGMLYPMQSNEKYIFTLIICGCVCVYSLWGGAKSVTYTDLYQFLFFGLSLPLIILVLFYTGKRDFATGIAHLQQMPSFSLTKVYQNIELTSAFLLSTLTALLRDPNTMVQRLFVVRSVRQVQGSFYKFAFGMLGIHVLFFIVACLMHIKGHVLAPNQTVVDYLLQLNAFPGMRGILASVLLALLMSTMDSMLHVATVTITGDIISHREESQHNITIVRMVCFCSCLLAFILAMHAKSLLHITRQYVVLSRGIMVVFMVTLLGFRPRGKVVVTVLGISTLHALYKMIWTPFVKDEEIVLQIGSIVAALFLGHYLFPKLPNTGWVKEVNLDVILQNQQTIRFWKQRLRTIEKILYIGHWAKYYPKSESTFFALGFYMIVSGTVGLFTMDTDRYFPSHIYWYFIPLVLGTLCATYPMTHSYKRGGNIFTHFIMWPLLLFVGLFISGIVMLVMGAYHPAICVIFVLNILIIYLLLSLPTAFGILLIGSMCMVMPFAHKLGYSFITSSFPSTFSIDIFLSWHGREVAAIVLLLIALICLAIHHKHYRRTMRRKMQEQDYTKNYAQRVELDHIQRVAYWEKLNPIDAGQELIEIANQMESKQKSILETKKELTLSKANVAEMADDIETIRNIGLFIKEADYDKYHRNYNIEIKKDIGHAFSLDDLLEDVYHKYRYLVKDRGEETPEILFDNHVKGLFIKADREKLRHMLIQNLLYTPHQGDLLVVTLQSTQLSYRYQIDKQTPQNSERSEKGIAIAISSPTERLAIADTYVVHLHPRIFIPKDIETLYLYESLRIIEAHGGYSNIDETEGTTTPLYVLPVDCSDVIRTNTFKGIDLFPEKSCKVLSSLSEEKKLIIALTENQLFTEEEVGKLIDFIKRAHGSTLRESGDPYYTHPIWTAIHTLLEKADRSIVKAALLHDILEDTQVSFPYLQWKFGKRVAQLVEQVTHMKIGSKRFLLSKEEQQLQMEHIERDALIIKLADRLHNVQTLYARSPADQKRVATETLDFFIPLGKKYGINILADGLKVRCEFILDNLKHKDKDKNDTHDHK